MLQEVTGVAIGDSRLQELKRRTGSYKGLQGLTKG